jgi:hypothetical protein
MADTTLDTFSALPPGGGSPDVALRIEDQLANPSGISVPQDPPVALGRAPAVDFVQRTFVPNTAGGPLMLYGLDTLGQWVEKAMRTRRGDNPACHPDFGLDALFLDLIDGGPFDSGIAAEFEAIVERALTFHPAIAALEEWAVDYVQGDDAALATFRVVPVSAGAEPVNLAVTVPA